MPSPPSTSLTIGSIFDLIGPTAPAPAAATGGQPFDSLLQAPPLPGAVSDQDSNKLRPTNETSRVDAKLQHSSNSAPAPDADETFGDSSDESQTRCDAASQVLATRPEAAPQNHGDRAPDQRQLPSSDQVVESLAGLSGANAAPQQATDGRSAGEQEPEEPIEPGAAPGKQHAPRIPATSAPAAISPPANPRADSSERPVAEQVHETQPKAGSETADLQRASTRKGLVSVTSRDEATRDEGIWGGAHIASMTDHSSKTQSAAQGDKPSQDQPQQSSRDSEVQALDVRAISLPHSAPDATAAPPPAMGAAPAATPAIDGRQNTPDANAANTPVIAATALRPRLPPELLHQPASGTSRRSAVEIDATRLLTRVARAFAVAQERDGEIHLRLSPPELGALRLEVRVQDGALAARLQTETDSARTAIIDNLPALRDRLAEQGVRIERFDVDLMQRQPSGTPDQPSNRQQELPAAPLRAVLPPRMRSETPVSPPSSYSVPNSTDGLNVIV